MWINTYSVQFCLFLATDRTAVSSRNPRPLVPFTHLHSSGSWQRGISCTGRRQRPDNINSQTGPSRGFYHSAKVMYPDKSKLSSPAQLWPGDRQGTQSISSPPLLTTSPHPCPVLRRDGRLAVTVRPRRAVPIARVIVSLIKQTCSAGRPCRLIGLPLAPRDLETQHDKGLGPCCCVHAAQDCKRSAYS